MAKKSGPSETFNKPVVSDEQTEAARSADALQHEIERSLTRAGIRFRWCRSVPSDPVVLLRDGARLAEARAIVASVEARLKRRKRP